MAAFAFISDKEWLDLYGNLYGPSTKPNFSQQFGLLEYMSENLQIYHSGLLSGGLAINFLGVEVVVQRSQSLIFKFTPTILRALPLSVFAGPNLLCDQISILTKLKRIGLLK